MLLVLNLLIMTKKDVAIIGGAFDPIHIGHMQMTKYLIDNCIVDEVWLLPSYNSPLKDFNSMTSFSDRVAMLNIAIKGISAVYVNTFEEEYYKNNECQKTYTYEILKAMQKKYLNLRFHFVIGFDSIKNINKWYRFKELLNDFWFYVFDRKDDEFLTYEQKNIYLKSLGKKYKIDFIYEMMPTKIEDISSTQIRKLLKNRDQNKENILKFIDENVYKYIETNNLYF